MIDRVELTGGPLNGQRMPLDWFKDGKAIVAYSVAEPSNIVWTGPISEYAPDWLKPKPPIEQGACEYNLAGDGTASFVE